MTDRFKFRVWDKHRNTYSAVAAIPCGNLALSDAGGLFWIESHCDCSELDAENYIVEQCTGVKDENRKLVYEGDIVLLNCEKWRVIWNCLDCAFFLACLKEAYYQPISPDFYMMADDFEVIGNIHENEDLLK